MENKVQIICLFGFYCLPLHQETITIKNYKFMVYFFVDKDGTEGCANEIPNRNFGEWCGWKDVYGEECSITTLPKGTIEKLIGRVLTWDNEPYYYTGIDEHDRLNNPSYFN